MARFVLAHGGWHGGWCFRWLAQELEDRGHEVASPDLPCEQVGLTPLDYAREVGPQPDAIVVGHSLGGFTIHTSRPAGTDRRHQRGLVWPDRCRLRVGGWREHTDETAGQ